MKNAQKQAILSILLTLVCGCSVETMNVGEGQGGASDVEDEGNAGQEQGPAPKEEGKEEEEFHGETTVTTKTTTETVVKTEAADEGLVFRLTNKNEAVDKFVSQNYCRGSSLNDCWLKSGMMKEVAGGWLVSLEFWHTSNKSEPYKVIEQTINGKGSVLLTTAAKMPDDDAVEYRFLWAAVDTDARTVDIVYDYASDGPQEQGDDTLESFTFEEAVP